MVFKIAVRDFDQIIEKNVSGFIKWFNFEENYGFVTTKNDGRDIHLHKNGISPLIPEYCLADLIIRGQVMKSC